MNLPAPTPAYSPDNEAATRRALEQEDKRNVKIGGDIEFINGKLIIRSPNGTRWRLAVADDGEVSTSAL